MNPESFGLFVQEGRSYKVQKANEKTQVKKKKHVWAIKTQIRKLHLRRKLKQRRGKYGKRRCELIRLWKLIKKT